MTDAELVERLREDQPVTQDWTSTIKCVLMDEAADRIEALTAEHNATLARLAGAVAREIALTAERDRLLSTVNALESLRPHWAQGYSSDSIAAQASTEALVGIWKILGVNDQTSAVVTLKALTANNVRLRAAIMFWLEAEEPDVNAAINMMRAALKGETP